MDQAKAKVSQFMGRSGEKDTTVHESVAPSVTQENVTPTRHEETQTAVDRESHTHHYHTSVQPISHQETLPEKHSHQVAGVEERTFHHGDEEGDKARVAAQASQFRDERTTADTHHTSSTAPTLAGEHHHHHVHETIQPVVQKQTIQPEVVHTTNPVHETHHHASQHHGTHALPPVSMSELQSKGVPLDGREERHDHFKGEPTGLTGSGHGHNTTSSTTGTSSSTGVPTSSTTGTTSSTTGTTSDTTGNPPGYSSSKPSLMDKINPKVDSTGDGKTGFMK